MRNIFDTFDREPEQAKDIFDTFDREPEQAISSGTPLQPVPTRDIFDTFDREPEPAIVTDMPLPPEPVDAPIQPEPEGRTFANIAKDVGIAALTGAIAVPEAAMGLLDIPTGGRAGKFAKKVLKFDPEAAKNILQEYYSDPQQKAIQSVEDAEGFWNVLKTAVKNPSVIAQTAIESAPSMGAGGALARGFKVAPWIAGAIGEGLVGAGLSAESIRQQTADELLTPGQSLAAVASGVGTGVFNIVGARLAKKFGFNDVDTLLAGGKATVPKNIAKGIAGKTKDVGKRIVAGGVAEGIFEEMPQSMQEQMWANAALGKPLFDEVEKAAAMGVLTGGAMGTGVNVAVMGKAASAPVEPPASAPVEPPAPVASMDTAVIGKIAESLEARKITPEDARTLVKRPRMEHLASQVENLIKVHEAQPVTDVFGTFDQEPGVPVALEPTPEDKVIVDRILKAVKEGDLTLEQAREIVKRPDMEHLASQVENLIKAPEEPMTIKENTKLREQVKNTIKVSLKEGSIEQNVPVRFTTIAELDDVLKKGELTVGMDFEGQPGISAQRVYDDSVISAYGSNKQKPVAIVFPESAVESKGQSVDEVKMKSTTKLQDLKFIVDGKLQTYEEVTGKPSPYKLPTNLKDKVTYNGLQEGFGKIPAMHTFTDKNTGSTFLVETEGMSDTDILTKVESRIAELAEDFKAAKPKPKVSEKEFQFLVDKGISRERAQEITGDTAPSVAQVRDAFPLMTAVEQQSVTENVMAELKEVELEKKELIKLRKEAFVPDKPIYTKKIKGLTKLIESKKKRLEGLKAQTTTKKEPTKPKSSTYADTGEYVSQVKSVVELPEIVEMAESLLDGKYPTIVKNMRAAGGKAVGLFTAKGTGRIKLRADIFEDSVRAAKILAHEIGHLVDYLPSKSMARGNILGRIASLKNYMKQSLPNKEGAPGALTPNDRTRYKYQARKAAEAEGSDTWIDEIIKKEFPVTPKDVLNVWNTVVGSLDEGLTDYIKGLNNAQKKAVVKDAMKGVVGTELQKFTKTIETPTGKKIKQSLSDKEMAVLVKKKYTGLINEELEKRKLFDLYDITKELKDLTLEWKPFDPKADAAHTKYRFSPPELYADAFSVLINQPGLLKATAPKFYEGFFNYLDSKPEVKREYESIQRYISNGIVDKNRTDKVYGMFKEGDAAYALSVKTDGRFKEALVREVFDAHWSIIKKVREIDPAKINPESNPIYKLEDMTYTGSELEWYLTNTTNDIVAPLEDAGLSWDDFGFELFLKRVANERSEIGNPMGWTPELSKKKLADMEKHRSPEQVVAMAEAGKKFKKLREYTIDKAEKAGRWDPEMIKIMRESEDYATFDVVKYIEKRMGRGPSASISAQIGTLNKVANPATATILKDMAIIKAVNRMVATESTVDFLSEHFPDDIHSAKKVKGTFVEPPVGTNTALVAYLKNGEPVGHYVDNFIADSFRGNPWEAQAVGKVFQALGQPFRMIFTELNPGFWAFNMYRDYFRAAGNLPKAKILNFAKDYLGAIKPAFKSAYGIPDPVVEEMLKGNMLVSIADYRGESTADKEIERLLKRYHLKPAAWNNFIMKPFGQFFTFYTNIGRGLERTTKVAGYTYLKRKFPDMPEGTLRHMVRNVGSPDFLRKGRAYPIYNNVLLFSNAIKEGYRGDVEAFSKSKAEWAWKKTKYAVLPKMLMYAAGVGLLGTGVKAIMDGIGEYDKTNYTTIPLGFTPNGKSVYMRVPIDETGRMIGGVSWKLFNKDKDKFMTGMMDYMAGQAPTVNPAIDALLDIAEYASGKNPYDSFRGRRAIPEQIFEAGGKRSHIEFLKYMYNKSGGSIVYKFKYDDVDKIKTELEEVLGYPIVSNIIGRFIKVSNQGLKEGILGDVSKIRQVTAQEGLAAKDAAYKMIRGEKLTEEDYLAILKKPDSLDRTLLTALSRKTGLIFAEAMLRAKSKKEKAVIFKRYLEREKLLND